MKNAHRLDLMQFMERHVTYQTVIFMDFYIGIVQRAEMDGLYMFYRTLMRPGHHVTPQGIRGFLEVLTREIEANFLRMYSNIKNLLYGRFQTWN